MRISLEPIGYVRNSRLEAEDDDWGGVVSEIVLADSMGADALRGIEEFSHVEVLFYFHGVDEAKVVRGARRPRNNPEWPAVGILAQRGKSRPNRLGLTTAAIIASEGKVLRVQGLDAIDGTPVLDIKPVMREFLPRGEVRQPAWATELMRAYWG
ncbi:MAG: SAM-dependent methyltransferase [Chloroflexi bacterium]|nr:SAM-dependent methyltransferase [Chloroflexota bacterium]